jgi:RND superfamily putative drug exporter
MTALIPVEQQIGEDKDRPEAAGELGDFVGTLTIADGATAEVTGEWPVWADFNQMNEEALHKAELLSGLPTLIMLFIAFGAMLAAGIPLILAIAGIATGFASLHLLSLISPISVWSMNFSMMIGLAVGIDYSLFIVSRYREERVEGKDAIKAIENAMSTSWVASSPSSISLWALPLGIIGKQFSCFSTTQSKITGPSWSIISMIASSRSAGSLTHSPFAPNASASLTKSGSASDHEWL